MAKDFFCCPFFKGNFAERKGFEPSIRFWRIHTFQACAFDHSATSLNVAPAFAKTVAK